MFRLLTTAVQKSESSSTTSSSSNQENVAIYPQIKSQVQLLLNEDPQTVFSRLDKICYEHSNSLKQLQDISDKQTKKKPLTDAEKFPINANQVWVYFKKRNLFLFLDALHAASNY